MTIVRWPDHLLVGGLLPLVVGLCACTPHPADGRFACDPDEPASCPDGFFCQVRGDVHEFRCYASHGEGYCGNGALDPGEACDGDAPVGTTCHELGYWYGTVGCSDRCQPDPARCAGLTAVAMGSVSTCILDDRGQAWCWGSNAAGILGEGSTDMSLAPQPVAASVPFASLAVGIYHDCALTGSGEAWCWGSNVNGQVGLGQVTDMASVPVPVATSLRFQQLAVGLVSTCGLDLEGRIWCWGEGQVGALGDGRFERSLEPVAVQSDAVFTQVASVMSTFCGLDTEGQAWCWGYAGWSQLGDGLAFEAHPMCSGEYRCSPVPGAVAGDHRFVALSRGNARHACGLDAEGRAWCWGSGEAGALGQGDALDQGAPVLVAGTPRLAAVVVGPDRTSALDEAGNVWTWGLGAAGDGASEDSAVPRAASLDGPASAVASGWGSTCAVQTPGRLSCWGFGGSGQLGASTRGVVPRPLVTDVPLDGLALGLYHTCALDPDGWPHCWGLANGAQLGSPVANGSYWPVPVQHGVEWEPFETLVAGNFFSAGLDVTGHVGLWGNVWLSETDLVWSYEPHYPSGSAWTQVAAGAFHLCVLDGEGRAFCWGVNDRGQLGSAEPPTAVMPAAVQDDHRFTRLALGPDFSCGLADDGAAWCWGEGDWGQLGDGQVTATGRPVAVAGGHRFVDLSCGWAHCCGVAEASGGWCWGANDRGALGSGSAAPLAPEPMPVASGGQFSRIVASYSFTCGLDVDGRAWCWGGSDWGEEVLGNGVLADRFVPVAVETDLRFSDLVSKGWHTCARDLVGAWHCWGGNALGQLGIDDQVATPRAVEGPETP